MVAALRKAYNDAFRKETYESFLKQLNLKYPGAIQFRLAETPVFIPKTFGNKMIEVCEHIIDLILDPDFKKITERSIPPTEKVPNEDSHPQMMVFDFAICLDEQGQPEPQLIEMQGFPSLFGFQVYYPDLIPAFFPVPDHYTQYLGKNDRDSYLQLLRTTILGDFAPENVILLDIQPKKQKTLIDFLCTEELIGIKPVCITELIADGNELYYLLDGRKTRVKRIYNRFIFDELKARKNELGTFVDLTLGFDVEWAPHPSWFYRISKFTLPFLKHPNIPQAFFLDEIKQIPGDLRNFVLKPLFSFAGQGVLIDVNVDDIRNIKDPSNWILQRKVNYAEIIQTPDTPAKAEIRIMYLWKKGAPRPEPAINLARLSKGKMIGVDYNKNKEWVGGSVAFFEH